MTTPIEARVAKLEESVRELKETDTQEARELLERMKTWSAFQKRHLFCSMASSTKVYKHDPDCPCRDEYLDPQPPPERGEETASELLNDISSMFDKPWTYPELSGRITAALRVAERRGAERMRERCIAECQNEEAACRMHERASKGRAQTIHRAAASIAETCAHRIRALYVSKEEE